jgi:peptidoglycan biosynthesis protein MviN/MurJ (putative lipid II flippase)
VLLAGINGVLSNAFYALDRVKIPALVMPVGTVVYLLVAPNVYEPWGVLGLALSPSGAYAVVFVLLLYFLDKRLPALRGGNLLLKALGYTALAVAAFGAPKLLLTQVAWHAFAEAAVVLAAGGALYLGVLLALRDATLREIYAYFKRAHPRFAR